MSDDDRRVCAIDGCGRKIGHGWASLACPRCLDRLERNIGDVTALWHELELTITRQNVTSTGTGRVTSERPLAYNAEASDRADNLRRTLRAWVTVARGGTEAALQASGRMSVHMLANALLSALQELAKRDDVVDLVDEVTYAIVKARQIIDRAPDRWYIGVCGHRDVDDDGHEVECDAELYALAGHDVARCRTCGTDHDVTARRIAMLDNAADELLTLTELTKAIGLTGAETVTRKQLEGWVRRGRLLRSGNIGATATYRVGDVIDLIRTDTLRKAMP